MYLRLTRIFGALLALRSRRIDQHNIYDYWIDKKIPWDIGSSTAQKKKVKERAKDRVKNSGLIYLDTFRFSPRGFFPSAGAGSTERRTSRGKLARKRFASVGRFGVWGYVDSGTGVKSIRGLGLGRFGDRG